MSIISPTEWYIKGCNIVISQKMSGQTGQMISGQTGQMMSGQVANNKYMIYGCKILIGFSIHTGPAFCVHLASSA